MTLKDAIMTVQEEYDREIKQWRIRPDIGQAASALLYAELDQIEATDIIETILQGRTFLPLEVQDFVETAVRMALRFGMRLQRKIDHPDKPTTVFDSPCAESVK